MVLGRTDGETDANLRLCNPDTHGELSSILVWKLQPETSHSFGMLNVNLDFTLPDHALPSKAKNGDVVLFC